jgi:hypothetical protein
MRLCHFTRVARKTGKSSHVRLAISQPSGYGVVRAAHAAEALHVKAICRADDWGLIAQLVQ